MTRVTLSALAAVAVAACADSSRPLEPGGAQLQVSGMPGYTVVDIGTLGGNFGFARHINDSGLVVGESRTAAGQTHAFLWKPGDQMIDLGTLGGAFSGALGINNDGVVVGRSTNAAGERRAFRLDQRGGDARPR